jgi:hypothetical protein
MNRAITMLLTSALFSLSAVAADLGIYQSQGPLPSHIVPATLWAKDMVINRSLQGLKLNATLLIDGVVNKTVATLEVGNEDGLRPFTSKAVLYRRVYGFGSCSEEQISQIDATLEITPTNDPVIFTITKFIPSVTLSSTSDNCHSTPTIQKLSMTKINPVKPAQGEEFSGEFNLVPFKLDRSNRLGQLPDTIQFRVKSSVSQGEPAVVVLSTERTDRDDDNIFETECVYTLNFKVGSVDIRSAVNAEDEALIAQLPINLSMQKRIVRQAGNDCPRMSVSDFKVSEGLQTFEILEESSLFTVKSGDFNFQSHLFPIGKTLRAFVSSKNNLPTIDGFDLGQELAATAVVATPSYKNEYHFTRDLVKSALVPQR